MKNGKVYIGTSGWHYKHWKGTFYPPEIKEKGQFGYYQELFNTVEINNSFYRLPSKETFESWYKASHKGFLFSIKANRFFTHLKKLNVSKTELQPFFSNLDQLKEKKGPVLFQLPPKWNFNDERLADFLAMLPPGNRYTFEFRNHDWYKPGVYKLLRKYNCAFCIYELAGHISPLEVTADFIYVRLHGPGNKYQGSYSDVVLREWANRCIAWQKLGSDVYIYFDNDQAGYAAFNALRIKEMILTKATDKIPNKKMTV